ncbi:flagellar biosynthesis protein FlhF [Ferrimonas lipolytica]|uniref:Flagellar biosynthesis protein FlhF n=1 Tax=Ferrimonas lipolytica TaxID=2724191 RepID=A0A6H1UE74_9GAMM|nr:flagellar biosynthesis protein FlhF [Ferrimonas lipolytica]QIZ77344.1 flagellar biosynthesis protein FlhF [Ferrimonas lipolytica]
MKIKRFFAKDMRTALAEVKDVLGAEAVIMSNKKVTGGVEIVAAVDFDAPPANLPSPQAEKTPAVDSARPIGEDRVSLSGRRQVANGPKPSAPNADNDGLRALLERQQQRRQQKQAQSVLSKQEQALPQWAQRAFEPEQPKPVKAAAKPSPVTSRNGKPRAASASAEITAMREEMSSIRQLLQHQMSNLMEQDSARTEPVRSMVKEQLRDLGFHREVAAHFAELLPQDGELHEVLAQLPSVVANQLQCDSENLWDEGGVIALVGPTGVGKTTTIAKLAARYAARFGVDQVALVTTDNYRIGAQEQLTTFGKIMGCPVLRAATVEELEQVLYRLRSRRMVLVDTAGMGQRDIRLVQQLEQLTGSSRIPIKPYLVVSSTAQYQVLQETVERFRRIDLAGSIITKLDEAHNIGDVLSVLLQNNLAVSYLTDGQRVPEDLRAADPHYLANRALADEDVAAVPLSPSQQHNAVGMYD